MKSRSILGVALAATILPASAIAADLPAIKTSAQNPVPECATPGRMMSYLKARNKSLEPRFEKIAVDYMRLGEELGVRWDYAFAQMAIETNYLSYRRAGGGKGDVGSAQNNFAGIGATGGGVKGESFADVATGVKAHLQHLLLYAGDPMTDAVAERTRKVHEWGVLKSFHAKIKGPVTFRHLSQKWAVSADYGNAIETHADIFYADFCTKADPQPELLAEARAGKTTQVAAADTKAEAKPKKGTELAKRAIEDGKVEGDDQRRGLGAKRVPKPVVDIDAEPEQPTETPAAGAKPGSIAQGPAAQIPAAKAEVPVKKGREMVVLNAPRGESEADKPAKTEKPAAAEAQKTEKVALPEKVALKVEKPAAPEKPAQVPFVTASAGGTAAKSLAPVAPGTKCRVWTASYGGQRAVIIKSQSDGAVNYTVLDVNEGAEKREAEAYIAAYAKGGAIAAEFQSQTSALDKAFEICPEG